MKKDVSLKVAEAIQDDVNKGIVRLDSSFMKDLSINPGDVIEIEGEKKTVAIVDRSYPGDIGLGIIRMDGLIRRNAKTGLGESVKIRKAEVKEAKKVTIAPAKKGIVVRASPNTFKRGLLGRAVLKGDIISLGGVKRRKTTTSDNPFFNEIFSQDDRFASFFADLKFIVVNTDSKEPVIISENTEISLNPEAVELQEETVPDVTYEDIGGLDDELKKVREMVELPLKHPEIFERLGIEPPKGVLMHGPPGTGKTLLAKAVANETNAHFILINGPEIMSKFYGESEANLRKKFEDAEKNAPSIIFIDEIDAIASKREETHGEVEKRVVAQLLGLMDGLQSRGKVIVIAASNIPNVLDPALRRPGRFDREMEIGVPGKDARLEILKIHTRNMPLEKDVKLKDLAEITHGFVGADLSALAKEAAMTVLRRIFPDIQNKEESEPIQKAVLEKLIIHQADFIEALKVVRPSALREVFVERPNVTWEEVGGLEETRQELTEAVEWPLKNPQAFKRLGIKPPKGILLYGPPGTGKTLLAKAIATETKANFISIKGPELLSKWVGESEKAVREIFKKARQTSPTIVFFDEIDSIAPSRNASSDNKVTEQVVNQLLTEMDGLEDLQNVVVIAATNRPDILDSALLRPGRFDRLLLTPVPDSKAREKIFQVHTASMPLKEVNVKNLAGLSDGYVGADIEAICREAAMLALREDIKAKEVTEKHFEDALKKVHPSVNNDIKEAYDNLEKQFRMQKAKEMDTVNYMG
ncbi:CDC48 family AAA ATPase [Candidatus Woesearchaeota archaeon]|jgi:transitional endoplasmic reticulum ATPase|nr:CDC48 family AAA ATPase [Candidatus Woesearchaeota archaeon]MBT4368662.1 CDC48 family AAA ATPase [Candidatus Woesearchaeota archaeon]MBT4712217.1 CDC48 family AAA ATPase [Candidatus Woesearchaeota archaeon]MBT6638951.1 CDC48 family AAA ATPase [Candidatus Woesearchaeota archaeon]MBT7134147.1 CDC48 family AAA ATPase [Candidatus Woesearchaeota archaeon]